MIAWSKLKRLQTGVDRSGRNRGLRTVAVALGIVTAMGLAGCESARYYAQSMGGHLHLMAKAQPLEQAKEDALARGDQKLARQLQAAVGIREFASRELGLPDNPSYRNYADLQRPYAVWNVFAAPQLSLSLKEWCFPVAGCVSYRGYYDRQEALDYAATLRADGWETQVAGIPAYSTLGFFNDPLLNTFIHLPEGELARLVFHELAHQVVYVPNDTAFNESFATAVEKAGVERWLTEHTSPDDRAVYQRFDARRTQFRALLLDCRSQLEHVYADNALTPKEKQHRKHEILAALRSRYHVLKEAWGGYAGYDRWFDQPLSNAHLAAIASYEQWVPAFSTLLARHGGKFHAFFDEVRRLAGLDRKERDAALRALGETLQRAEYPHGTAVALR